MSAFVPTQDEQAEIDAFVDAVERFQAGGDPEQARRWGHVSDFGQDSGIAHPTLVDVAVDTYTGGYVIALRITRAGTQYWKAMNRGPETWREQDWYAVPHMTIEDA